MIRTYFTLKELQTVITAEGPVAAKRSIGGSIGMVGLINNIIGTGAVSVNENEETRTLLQDYLWPELYNTFVWYIDTCDGNVSDEDFAAEKLDFGGRLWRIFTNTYPKYSKLISYYAAIENDLMKNITSSSTTAFNDTPQEDTDVGEEGYTTNLTKTSTETEGDTPIARLDEIRRKIVNYYEKWCDEFTRALVLY